MIEDDPSPTKKLLDVHHQTGVAPLANQLQAIARLAVRSALRVYPKELELSFVHAAILGAIGSMGPISARELSVLLTMNEGQVSTNLRTIIKNGFVNKVPDPSDARRSVLALTRRGKSIYAKVIEIQKNREDQFLAGVNNSDRKIFFDTLNRIRTNAEAVLSEKSS